MPAPRKCDKPEAWALPIGALVALGGCMNDWDALRPIDQQSSACSAICAAKQRCIGSQPGCEGSCSADVLECSTSELDKLRECAQVLESACSPSSAAQAAWSACLVQVSCYTE